MKKNNKEKINNKIFQPHYLQYSSFIPHIHLFSNLIICMRGYDAIIATTIQFYLFFSLCSSLGFNRQLVS